jgi:hypothetical protein
MGGSNDGAAYAIPASARKATSMSLPTDDNSNDNSDNAADNNDDDAADNNDDDAADNNDDDAADNNDDDINGEATTQRTVVFVDYQNMYRSAREAFGWVSGGGHFGNFRPYGLGRQVVRERGRVLSQVRVYTGIHTPQRNPKQHGQMQRRMMAWVAESPEKVEVFPRSL